MRVFISHSGKDDEPGEASDPIRAHAREVRGLIAAGLRAAGHDVLLDVDALRPGDRWRPRLHRWLDECDGAVILFDSRSIASPWLRKEALILAWRASLDSRVTVVPVFLSGFRAPDLGELAEDIGPIQAAKLKQDALAAGGAGPIADLVVARFPAGAAPGADQSEMGLWLEGVAGMLERAGETALAAAADALGFDDEDRGLDRLSLTLAHHMLHAGVVESRPALEAIRAGLRQRGSAQIFAPLVDALLPTWVDPEAAALVKAQLAAADGPTLVVNVGEQFAGRDYMARAECREFLRDKYVAITLEAGEGGVAELLAQVRAELEDELDDEDAAEILRRRPALVNALVGSRVVIATAANGSKPELLTELRSELSAAAYVLLAGVDGAAEATARMPGAVLVRPLVDAELEERVVLWHLDAKTMKNAA